MRMSHHFGETLRAAPSDVEVASHALLLRAGYVRPLAAGIFSLLPLGVRMRRKIEAVVREEMDAIGGEEVSMPVVHPAEVWKETGRWYEIDEEMARFTDRAGREMVLGMTHEEIVADLARREVQSYRQLPMLVYQIQTKFRDEPRPRAGLIRVREFTMEDSYSLDADFPGLERQYRAHYDAYFRIFRRIGLEDVIAVQSDTGMMGGTMAHEYMVLSDIGEDTLVLCDACGASANMQVARFRKPKVPDEAPRLLERVPTPGASTIEDLSAFLGIGKEQTAKVVFFTATVQDEEAEGAHATCDVLVMALVRGDMEVNETKLANAIRARRLVPAEEAAIRATGAVPGYASPIGIDRNRALVVADDLIAVSPNLVSGANEADVHFLNVNAGRDYTPDITTDIASASAGAPCVHCGAPLRLARGIEVGNIFQLGTRYTEAFGATYVGADHERRPIVMGSYGIGIDRCLAVIAEKHRDERGLVLPAAVSPYDVALVRLGEDPEIVEKADALYEALLAAGVEVMYDDRELTAGVKFADADLMGFPLRVTIAARSLKAGGVEMKRRNSDERRIVTLDEVVGAVRAEYLGSGA